MAAQAAWVGRAGRTGRKRLVPPGVLDEDGLYWEDAVSRRKPKAKPGDMVRLVGGGVIWPDSGSLVSGGGAVGLGRAKAGIRRRMTVTHAIAHDGGILLGQVRGSDCTQADTKAHQGGDMDRRWWRSPLSECGLANGGQGRTPFCESASP